MNKKDEKILEILKKDSSLSTRKIARLAKLPITTTHNRIKKLEQEGIITGYTIKVNHSKLGRDLTTFILINVDYKKVAKDGQFDLLKKLLKHSDIIDDASYITGRYDIIVKARFKNIKEMNDFIIGYILQLDAIENTMTLVELHE